MLRTFTLRYAHSWRALGHRNFRLFFAGQGISLIGTWITRVALGWLVFRLTGSAFMLGAAGFTGQILTFLLAPVAGVLVDRLDRRKILVWTQVTAGLQSAVLAWLTLAKVITVKEVLLLSVVQGLIDAIDFPARQSFMSQMIEDQEDLVNAIALNSSIVNGARLVGPAVAGWLIAWSGEGLCFSLDAISYLAVIATLLSMRLARQPGVPNKNLYLEMREGWAYVTTYTPVRTLLLLFALLSLIGTSASVLLPVVANRLLHGGPNLLGYLVSASGIGALLSALSLAVRRSVLGLTTMIHASVFLLSAGLITLGASRRVDVSCAAMLILGFAALQSVAAGNTVIQTIVPETTRGRVMSYFNMSVVGVTPFGSLLAGILGQRIGTAQTLILMGVTGFIVALWFSCQLTAVRGVMKPLYLSLGILSDPGKRLT